MGLRRALICGIAVAALTATAVPMATAGPGPTGSLAPGDWRTYGGSANHTFNNKPHLIAGTAGGYFKTGRYVKYPVGTPHNILLTAIAQSMGVTTDHVGDPEFKTTNLALLKGS